MRQRRASDAGSGILSATVGVLIFFVLLVFTVQVTFNLYTTSVVTGLALDAARDVAERNGVSPADAESSFYDSVDGNVSFDIVVVGDVVRADVEWKTRSLFPAFSNERVFGVLDRTFEVRIEEQQD